MSDVIREFKRILMPAVLLAGMTGISAPAQGQASAFGGSGLLQALEAEISTLFESNRRCVVRIHTIYGPVEDGMALGLGNGYTHGTGFLIDNAGHILTVDKAVTGGSEIRVTLADETVSRATLVASDPASDVAVIRISDAPNDHIVCGDSDGIRIGHYSFILGNAYGQLLPSIGSVYEVTDSQDLIQITSSVYPSYGGAPVFNSSGQVVGMVWAAPLHSQAGTTLTGISDLPTSVFVIPINRARRIASTLIERGQMAYGWLGVEVDRETQPVAVTRVAQGGPAWRSGIRPGDRIISYNGQTVAGPFHLERLVMGTSPGDAIPIRVRRESITVSTEATMEGRRAGAQVTNPHGQLVGMDANVQVAPDADVVQVDQQLFDQIKTLEKEITRLQLLMQKAP